MKRILIIFAFSCLAMFAKDKKEAKTAPPPTPLTVEQKLNLAHSRLATTLAEKDVLAKQNAALEARVVELERQMRLSVVATDLARSSGAIGCELNLIGEWVNCPKPANPTEEPPK